MLLLLLWFHQQWWNDGLIGGPDRWMKCRSIPEVSRMILRLRSVISNSRSKPPFRLDRIKISWSQNNGLAAVMKSPMIPYSLRINSVVGSIVGGHRMKPSLLYCSLRINSAIELVILKPPISKFQGQSHIFTMLFIGLYKYITLSSLWTNSFISRTLKSIERFVREKAIKIAHLNTQSHLHMH